MGFTVTDDLTFNRYGVTVAGCYVTIKATYSHNKLGIQQAIPSMIPGDPALPYQLSARYYVYSDQAGSDVMSCLDEGYVSISTATVQDNPIATLYAAIKQRYFSDKTTVDS